MKQFQVGCEMLLLLSSSSAPSSRSTSRPRGRVAQRSFRHAIVLDYKIAEKASPVANTSHEEAGR